MAIQHTLFISATRLKRDTILGGSVDDDLIMPYILLAQDMNILPILGTDLDAKLKTEIQGGTLANQYKTLVEGESISYEVLEYVPAKWALANLQATVLAMNATSCN